MGQPDAACYAIFCNGFAILTQKIAPHAAQVTQALNYFVIEKNMFKNMLVVVGMLVAVNVHAGGWTGYRDVTMIGVRGDSSSGFYFMLSGSPNPDSCGLIDHYFVRNTNPMIKEMYSLVLAAKKSGTKITAQLDGCDNGRPKVISVIES